MLHKEVIFVNCEHHMKQINSLCGANTRDFNVKREVHKLTTGVLNS